MAIGSDSTDGQGLIKLPKRLFLILQKLSVGGLARRNGGKTPLTIDEKSL